MVHAILGFSRKVESGFLKEIFGSALFLNLIVKINLFRSYKISFESLCGICILLEKKSKRALFWSTWLYS